MRLSQRTTLQSKHRGTHLTFPGASHICFQWRNLQPGSPKNTSGETLPTGMLPKTEIARNGWCAAVDSGEGQIASGFLANTRSRAAGQKVSMYKREFHSWRWHEALHLTKSLTIVIFLFFVPSLWILAIKLGFAVGSSVHVKECATYVNIN